MKVTYDKYYQPEDLFGETYPELIGFFAAYPKKEKYWAWVAGKVEMPLL